MRWGFLIWELIFIYCGLFVLILVVFLGCFFFHYVSAKFHLWPSSGDLPRPRIGMMSLVTVSPVITAFHSCYLSHHVFDQVNPWPAWVGFETAIFWQWSPGTVETQRLYPLRHGLSKQLGSKFSDGYWFQHEVRQKVPEFERNTRRRCALRRKRCVYNDKYENNCSNTLSNKKVLFVHNLYFFPKLTFARIPSTRRNRTTSSKWIRNDLLPMNRSLRKLAWKLLWTHRVFQNHLTGRWTQREGWDGLSSTTRCVQNILTKNWLRRLNSLGKQIKLLSVETILSQRQEQWNFSKKKKRKKKKKMALKQDFFLHKMNTLIFVLYNVLR